MKAKDAPYSSLSLSLTSTERCSRNKNDRYKPQKAQYSLAIRPGSLSAKQLMNSLIKNKKRRGEKKSSTQIPVCDCTSSKNYPSTFYPEQIHNSPNSRATFVCSLPTRNVSALNRRSIFFFKSGNTYIVRHYFSQTPLRPSLSTLPIIKLQRAD